jgi:hypothetical protein
MHLKNIGAAIILMIILTLLLLFFFKPEVFYRILDYKGPGSPFVHPPQY